MEKKFLFDPFLPFNLAKTSRIDLFPSAFSNDFNNLECLSVILIVLSYYYIIIIIFPMRDCQQKWRNQKPKERKKKKKLRNESKVEITK